MCVCVCICFSCRRVAPLLLFLSFFFCCPSLRLSFFAYTPVPTHNNSTCLIDRKVCFSLFFLLFLLVIYSAHALPSLLLYANFRYITISAKRLDCRLNELVRETALGSSSSFIDVKPLCVFVWVFLFFAGVCLALLQSASLALLPSGAFRKLSLFFSYALLPVRKSGMYASVFPPPLFNEEGEYMPFSSSLFMEVPIPCGSMKRKTLCALRIFSIFPSLTLPCPSLFFFFSFFLFYFLRNILFLFFFF